MAVQKTRNASVPRPRFLAVYIAGCAAGKTTGQIATDLGMAETSVSARASQERSKLAKVGKKLPYPAGKERSGVNDEEFTKLLEGLEPVEAPATNAVETPVSE